MFDIYSSLKNIGIPSINSMQEKMIKTFKDENEIMLISPTGSGKTLAFLLPVLQSLDSRSDKTQTVIIVPSRELALQTEKVLQSLKTGFKTICSYGGHDINVENRSLSVSPTIVIGTPGRILYHLEKKNLNIEILKTIILDEFDKILEFGFHEEMKSIFSYIRQSNKKILTSATNSIEIPQFIPLTNLYTIDFSDNTQNEKLNLQIVPFEEKEKFSTLYNLLCELDSAPTIIFCNFRERAEEVSRFLTKKEVDNEYFHGGMDQTDRERSLFKFRNGSSNILIATDLAARGLDIPEIKYIIHFHIPQNQESFIHRNGRTARMHSSGNAFILLEKNAELPLYIDNKLPVYEFTRVKNKPEYPKWLTLYIGKGKKDKVNKIDIVGFLCQKGKLQKDEIGMIELKDFFSYVAIKRKDIPHLLSRIRTEKIKNMKTKFSICK